ncbi:pre-B-cell leukemia homeobox interacting protein 1b isoform X2 [Parambassis ranga]|uniref:Pre-B-cell leukemia homeobox interacting protein 1b isoform X2 n=1 Tax=Parambassis ranga TaxID=210632 RepID=A0A6P7JYT5_9TELE|nr:pre-B-cell leukemia transcription factor-interacting protein 1 isoform X2 [Parambassis ranga]
MSGSSANNSWTILTPEESVADTLRPLAGAAEHHAGPGEKKQPEHEADSAAGLLAADSPIPEEKAAELSRASSTDQHTSVPTAVSDTPIPSSPEVSGSLIHGSGEVSQTEGPPEGPAQFSPDPDSSSDSYSHMTPSPDEPALSPLSTETLGGAEFAQEKETQEETLHPLNGEEPCHEGDESDQYSRKTDLGKQAVHLVDQLVMDLFRIWARKLSGEAVVDSPLESEVVEEGTEKTEEVAESEVRRRSLLAALEQIGRREEEEEEEEEFQLPQREADSGFSLNKCILGALILLGLGTIFFSESDYGTRELRDTDVPGKQEWLNPEVSPPADVDSSHILNKLAEGNQQISELQAQLQEQKEELKVARGQAAEGVKERLQWEEVEKENSRLKTQMASLPVLQKENERMKKELQSVPALQKELEKLRSTVTELKLSSVSQTAEVPVKSTASPPTGSSEYSRQGTAAAADRQDRKAWDDQKKKDLKKDKYDRGEKKEWKERDKPVWKEGEKKERKDGGKKEAKSEKPEQRMFDKEKEKEDKQKRHSDETKQWKEKEWKKEKLSRGDEGKPWKDREGKKEWTEKSEKKEWKKEKDWKKVKHEKIKEGKQWREKEENHEWKEGKDHGERHRGKEEWKGEKEWKKVKDGFKESGKEKWEKKDLKEKGEKEWKKETEWRDKNGKEHGKEGKARGERKQWEDTKNHGKDKMGKEERKQWNEHEWKSKNGKHDKEQKRKYEKENQWKNKEEDWKREQKERKHNGEAKKDRSNSHRNKDGHKFAGDHAHKEEHLYGDRKPPHTHYKPSLEQPEYWVQQRHRLQHNHKPPQQCNSLESCAQAEHLLPVPLQEFQAILQTYLTKAKEVGVDDSKIEELKKLASEFFKDGLFVHDQISFQDFVEDLGDILEDMVEGDEGGEEEDSAIEEEMEGFEIDVLKKFLIPGAEEKQERIKGEWRKESRQGRG